MPARSAPVRLELKAVDTSRRTILAYAAVFGNVDRQNEVIEPQAFDRSLRTKKLADISVLVGHDAGRMPVGVPLSIKPDNYGLLTQTKVFATAAGEELLQAAKELKAAGSSLGLSIGYNVLKDAWGTVAGKSARILQDLDLGEYSFLPGQWAAANPAAHVVDVKAAAGITTLYQVLGVDDVPWSHYLAASRMADKAREALGLPFLLAARWCAPAPAGADWRDPDHWRVHGPTTAKAWHSADYLGSLFLKASPDLDAYQAAWLTAHEAAHAYQRYRGVRADEAQADDFAYQMMEDQTWLA